MQGDSPESTANSHWITPMRAGSLASSQFILLTGQLRQAHVFLFAGDAGVVCSHQARVDLVLPLEPRIQRRSYNDDSKGNSGCPSARLVSLPRTFRYTR